jgi:tetratricopeptide (TPR) repeat protein
VRLRPSNVALGAAISIVMSATLTAARPAWKEVRGEYFVLRARDDFKRIDEVACDIERIAGMLRNVKAAPESAAIPAIVAVDSERDARELLPQFWERRGARPIGAYWEGLHGHHIVVRVNVNPRERFRRLLHEYVHFATRLTYPKPLPWLDEGLAEIWTHAAIEADYIEIGRPVDRHLKALQSGKNWIPLAELTAASDLPSARDATRVRQFYAQSWLLAHYLAFEAGQGMNGIRRQNGIPTDDELRRYARGEPLRTVKMMTEAANHACIARQVHALSEAESSLLKGQMLADGQRPNAALPLITEALKREPNKVSALEALAFVYFTGNRLVESAAIFDRTIAGGSATFASYYYRAILATPVPQRTDGPGRIPAAEYLAQAVRLNPAFAPARERLLELSGR